jgi:hypothetical protein
LGSNTDAGDQYIGLDRFGRVADHRWVLTSNGIAKDRTTHRDLNGSPQFGRVW